MNKFEDRKKSFETKFARDEELQFKVAARTNKYLGQWVSSKLKKIKEDELNAILCRIPKAQFMANGKYVSIVIDVRLLLKLNPR